MEETIKPKARDHDSYLTYTIISILIPIAGFILGIIMLTKDRKIDKKLGEHALALSILFAILWPIIWFTFIVGSSSSPDNLDPVIDSSDIFSEESEVDLASSIVISNTSFKDDGFGIYEIVGEAKNTDTNSRTFTLLATFYANDGSIIGTALGSLSDVGPGDTKTFNLVSTDDVKGYKNYKIQIDSIY